MTTYRLTSVKGVRTVTGTLAQARAAARKMDEEMLPAGGISIEIVAARDCGAEDCTRRAVPGYTRCTRHRAPGYDAE